MGFDGIKRVEWARLGAALALALLAGGANAQVVPDSIPANTQELRDFRIDPQPAPPPPLPPAAEIPAPVPEPAAEPTPAPVDQTAPAVRDVTPTRRRRAPRSAEPQPAQPRASSDAVERVDRPEVPSAEVPVAEVPPAEPRQVPPSSQVEAIPPEPLQKAPVERSANDDAGSDSLLPIALGLALAALVGGLVWRRRKRPAVIVEEFADPHDIAEPLADAMVESVPVIAPADVIAHAPRPDLAIAFKPAAAGATDSVASVDYTLVVSNTGDAPASKVRMEARMFAMGQDHDAALASFFAGPLERPTPIASAVPPGVDAALRAQVTLPRGAVNPIQVRDRTVFVPLVAFNVLYEWYDADGGLQHGQTVMSYVVGRENRPPAEKMAPFRLDQGPRIYREVGQRVHQLKQVA